MVSNYYLLYNDRMRIVSAFCNEPSVGSCGAYTQTDFTRALLPLVSNMNKRNYAEWLRAPDFNCCIK